MRRRIDGMVVAITGASAGIGRALAEELSRRGAKLALAARRSDRLEELNRALGGRHLVVSTDVAVREQCEALVARTLAHFGRLDTLVCNAGYGFLRPVAETTPEDVQRIFQTNVFGTADCVRPAVAAMRRQERREGWRGQVVIVTGASAGIGRALAEELSRRGARLALAARRSDRLEELNRALGGRHLVVSTDVAVREECEALVARTLAHFGGLDTLVCNAGYGFLRPVAETTPEDVQRIFQTNVFGTADCVRPAVAAMRQQEVRDGWRGQVVVVTSAVARRALPYFGAYSATKAAQLSLAEAMRVELRKERIAVTSVHPVGTDTEFGDVSAAQSEGRRPETRGEVRQSADAVARAIVKGIERPRPEVWPLRPARWALGIAALFPGAADRLLAQRMLVMEKGKA